MQKQITEIKEQIKYLKMAEHFVQYTHTILLQESINTGKHFIFFNNGQGFRMSETIESGYHVTVEAGLCETPYSLLKLIRARKYEQMKQLKKLSV